MVRKPSLTNFKQFTNGSGFPVYGNLESGQKRKSKLKPHTNAKSQKPCGHNRKPAKKPTQKKTCASEKSMINYGEQEIQTGNTCQQKHKKGEEENGKMGKTGRLVK